VFKERLFKLAGMLQKIADRLAEANVPYEVVGGLAVLIHVEAADPAHSVLRRDADILIRRCDLDRVIVVSELKGFKFRYVAGVDMLLYGDKAINAVHLLFSGEKVRPSQLTPNPPLAPERKIVKGREVRVIALADLERMKLGANRDKDRVHIRCLDAAGLIKPKIERGLPRPMRARLQQVRETE
jgi:hypothetical protein